MNGVDDLRQVLLTRPEAFRTNIAEALILYLSTGTAKVNTGNAATLFEARRILRELGEVHWPGLIAAVARR